MNQLPDSVPSNGIEPPKPPLAKLYVEPPWYSKLFAICQPCLTQGFWTKQRLLVTGSVVLVLLLLITRRSKEYDVYEVNIFDMPPLRSYSAIEYREAAQSAVFERVETYYSQGEPRYLGKDTYEFRRHPDGLLIKLKGNYKEFRNKGPSSTFGKD